MNNQFNEIIKHKVIAIIRGVKKKQMIPLVESLLEGGICCLEVTFDHTSENGIEETIDSISTIKHQFDSQVVLGAGTVLTASQVEYAYNAGAAFMISPNVSVDVIKKTISLGAVSIPGAMTPSEIVAAYDIGADIVKMFPAGIFGTSYIKAVKAPLQHIPLMSVGGITDENMVDFLKAGACGVGVGGNLVNLKHIKDNNFNQITIEARKYTKALESI